MDFKELMAKIENFGKNELIYWSNALAGEVGELCNLVKKFYRDRYNLNELSEGFGLLGILLENRNEDLYEGMKEELADIFIYIALTARDILKIDLEAAILGKLEVIKERRETTVSRS